MTLNELQKEKKELLVELDRQIYKWMVSKTYIEEDGT